MKLNRVLEAVREEFHKLIEMKTGWGKEEVKLQLEIAIAQALMKLAEGEEE